MDGVAAHPSGRQIQRNMRTPSLAGRDWLTAYGTKQRSAIRAIDTGEASIRHLSIDEATALAHDVLCAAGVGTDAAALQADLVVEAELRGHRSHGLLRIPTIVGRIRAGLIDPSAEGRITWRGTALADIDGENGLGCVVGSRAVDVLAQRAEESGVAAAALRRTSHLGMLSWYVERVARRGQIAIATCTSEALVHPWQGRTAMLGTNPLAIAVPAEPDPLVLDMSTGAVSMGRVIDHARRGVPLSPGWAVDAAGEPTTDPADALLGAISPFGGAKGYALGVALEALIGSLTGTPLGRDVHGTLDETHPVSKGDVFIVFDRPATDATAGVSAYLDAVRRTPPRDERTPVTVPGDGSARRREAALASGIDVADETLAALHRLLPSPPGEDR